MDSDNYFFAMPIKKTSKAQRRTITLLIMIINSFELSELLKTMLPITTMTANIDERTLMLADFLVSSRETPKTVPRVRTNDTPPMMDTRVLCSALLPHEYNP